MTTFNLKFIILFLANDQGSRTIEFHIDFVQQG